MKVEKRKLMDRWKQCRMKMVLFQEPLRITLSLCERIKYKTGVKIISDYDTSYSTCAHLSFEGLRGN